MISYLVVDSATGGIVRGGQCQPSTLAAQAVNPGEVAYEVPDGVISWPEPNLGVLRTFMWAQIDAAAESFCKSFVTPGETQMVRYQRKEAQARAYLADSNASVPMLEAEATATGVTVATLAATVVAIADAWGGIMDAVEGARIGAKKAVQDATGVHDIFQAAVVDWQGLLS
jgi:hypothetical protein